MGWNPFKAAYNAVSATVEAAVTTVATVVDTAIDVVDVFDVVPEGYGLSEGIDAIAGSDIAGNRDAIQDAVSNAGTFVKDQVMGTEKPVLEPALDEAGNPVLDEEGNPVLEPVLDPVLDEEGNLVLDEKGQPLLEPRVTHGWIHDTAGPAIKDAAIALTKAETYVNAGESVANFSKFAWNNPGRAAALATQGVVNAVSSTVGFAADAVYGAGHALVAVAHNVGYDSKVMDTRETIALLDENNEKVLDENGEAVMVENPTYNQMIENEELMSYTKESGFFGFTTGLTDALQIRNLPIKNEAFQNAFGEIQAEITVIVPILDTREMIPLLDENNEEVLDEYGDARMVTNPTYGQMVDTEEKIPNPNANYERVLLYGPQAVAEVGIFLATSAVTAGAGGAAYATARAGYYTARATMIARAPANLVKAALTVEKAARTVTPFVKAGVKAEPLTARTTEMVKRGFAVKDAVNSGSKLAKIEATVAKQASTKAVATEATELATKTATTAAKATDELAAAIESGTKTADEIAALTQNAAEATAKSTAAAEARVVADAAASAAEKSAKKITEKATVKATTAAEKGAKTLSETPKVLGKEISGSLRHGREIVKDLNADDLLQHVARNGKKSFDKIDDATKILNDAASTPKQLAKANAQIAKSEAKLTELIDKTNVLAKSKGLEPVTMAAAKATDVTKVTMTSAQYISNTARSTASNTHQFLHPLRDKTSAIIEVTAAGGVMGMGIYANQKAAEAKRDNEADVNKGVVNSFLNTTQSKTSGNFNTQSRADQAPLDTNGINTGHDVKTQFDNRTSGDTFIPNSGFSIEIEVSPEEAKVLEKTLGGN